jgi:hypothetical protein
VQDLFHADMQSVLNDSSTWLILDGQQRYPLIYHCRMLLACSMKRNNHHEFGKHAGAKKLFLHVWTWDEMDQFCDDFSLYRDDYKAMDVPDKEKV